jgi:hypothetical protein
MATKGRAVTNREATLGLRDWDRRTADPSALGMTNRKGWWVRGERRYERAVWLVVQGNDAFSFSDRPLHTIALPFLSSRFGAKREERDLRFLSLATKA